MTTQFVGDKTFALSKFHCHYGSQEKQRFWTIVNCPLCPQAQTPSKRKTFFYYRLAVSDPGKNYPLSA